MFEEGLESQEEKVFGSQLQRKNSISRRVIGRSREEGREGGKGGGE